jgi:hypothetical protein
LFFELEAVLLDVNGLFGEEGFGKEESGEEGFG